LWRRGTLGWQTEQVEVQTGGSIQTVNTYTTEFTVVDSYGLPCPGSAVQIYASEGTLITVNGVSAWIDNANAASAGANGAGQVTIVTQTGSLSTPLLKIWTDQMPEGR
jgi:hypothetical protein